MHSFHEMGLDPFLIRSLDKMNLTQPTPIQAQTIPLSLVGKDVLGSAQTGTGKTLAFGIPLVSQLLKDQTSTALVLAPTRELAQQVMQSIRQLTGNSPQLKMALLIGGESIFKQFKQLRVRPRIVVGTPGRVIDHLLRRSWDPETVRFLVLDETDRMLDMGFGIQLEEIIPKIPKERQTLMFSATFPKNILNLAGKYLRNPERVSIGSPDQPAANVKQEMIRVSEGQKYRALLEQLSQREGSIIVFVKTKIGAERLAEKLNDENHEALAIHGDLHQHKRDRVIRAFRAGKQRIMVATDVAARGLDIPHIQHVINYDLPQCPEDYIHRIGRTARAGAEGSALCFVTPQEGGKWHAIHRFMNPSAPREKESHRPPKRSFSKSKRSGSGGGGRSANGKSDYSRSFKSDAGSARKARPKRNFSRATSRD